MSGKDRIGLIAGSGRFPILWAQSAKSKGVEVVCFAIKGNTSPKIRRFVDRIFWFNVYDFSSLLEAIRGSGVRKMVMAGQINPFSIFDPRMFLDLEIKTLLEKIKDRRADTVFTAVIQRIEQEGVEFIPSTSFMDAYMARVGTLTRSAPEDEQWQDVYFGRDIAQRMGDLDIGQTVVVKNRTVLAVEAFEGTNRCIMRAGLLVPGAVVVKMSKPRQDLRFDVPVVGMRTIKVMALARASVLAVEAGKTIILDKERVVRSADRLGIKVVAVQGAQGETGR